MKHALLFFILLPLFLYSNPEDPRLRKEAPYKGLLQMRTTYFFKTPSDGDKLDSAILEVHDYNRSGYLLRYDYNFIEKSNPRYSTFSTCMYFGDTTWTKKVYVRDVLTDSVLVNGSWANWYNIHQGVVSEMHEYRLDSTQEKVINGGDTIFRAKVHYLPKWESFWDFQNAGPYSPKNVISTVNTDTTRIFDDKNKCMLEIVNHYDNNFKPIKTDYYNYRRGRFDFMHLPYNEKLNMTFFLGKSKKGKWSYEVLRKYDVKGLLIEEAFIDANPRKTTVIKRYYYTFYQ